MTDINVRKKLSTVSKWLISTFGASVNSEQMAEFYFQEQAVNSEHLWVESNASGDYCYAMEQDCIVSHGLQIT